MTEQHLPQPPKCYGCGKPLKKHTYFYWPKDGQPEPRVGLGWQRFDGDTAGLTILDAKQSRGRSYKTYQIWLGEWGRNGNGIFCTTNCAETWALWVIRHGRCDTRFIRMIKKPEGIIKNE